MGPLPGGTPAVEGAGDFEDELGALRQLLRTGTLNLQVRLLDDGAMNGAAVEVAQSASPALLLERPATEK